MDIKTSTKAYANRTDPGFISKSSGVKTESATELSKMGSESVGDTLNRIADPQWVDPSKKLRSTGDSTLDKDAFMKLMLTQMKHQDPTNPMQAHEMAAQLASFTSVEQLQNLNSTLDSMKKAQAPAQQFEALNLIGKSVAGDSAQLTRVKGDTNHMFQYKLLKDAADVTLKVQNAQGETVRTVTMKQLKAGANGFNWNGQDENGAVQPLGDYKLVVEASDNSGKKVGVESQFDGVITGINFSGEGPLLMVGNRTVKMSDVRKIVDPNLKQDGQKSEKSLTPDLQQGTNQKETVKSNLNNVAMSRGMINKLESVTKKDISL
ncbi:MAG: basal-body rod modification protein flgD [Pseudomonadota bacterium]|jgi:flagellar basal-body rod modification protein FlgD